MLTGLVVWASAKHPSPPLQKHWQNSAKEKKLLYDILDSFFDLNTMGATSYTQLMNDHCNLSLEILMLIQQNILYSDQFLMLYLLIKRIYI